MNYHSRYPSSSVTPLIFHIPKCSQKCPAYIFLKGVINNRTCTRHPLQNYRWSKRLRDRVGVSFLSFQQNEYFHNFRCTVIYFTESSIMCQTFYPNEVKIHENVCIHFLFYAMMAIKRNENPIFERFIWREEKKENSNFLRSKHGKFYLAQRLALESSSVL